MMAGKIKISELKEFDIAEYLDDDETIASYLNDAIEISTSSGDPNVFKVALGNIARARGMGEIAKKSGLGRESLYKTFAPEAKPRFDTMQRVFASMNMQMKLVPIEQTMIEIGSKPSKPKAVARRAKRKYA